MKSTAETTASKQRSDGAYKECVVCAEWPTHPHGIVNCPHVFCYFCLQVFCTAFRILSPELNNLLTCHRVGYLAHSKKPCLSYVNIQRDGRWVGYSASLHTLLLHYGNWICLALWLLTNAYKKLSYCRDATQCSVSCEIRIRGHSSSLEIVPMSRADTSSYLNSLLTLCLFCTVYEIITTYLCDIATFQHPSPI